MMLSFRLFAVLVGILAGLTDETVGDSHTKNRDDAAVTCTRDAQENHLRMRLVTNLKGDDINYSYGLENNEESNVLTYTTCSHTTEIADDEFGNSNTYIIVETVIDLDNPSYGSADNPCGFQAVIDTNTRGYKILLALRKMQGFEFGVDGAYEYTCYENTTTQTYLVASMDIADVPFTKPEVKIPGITFQVLRQDSTTLEVGFVPDNTCIIGENLKLQLILSNTEYISHLTPWGLYAFQTRVASAEEKLTNPGEYFVLVNNNGCGVPNNRFGLGGGWYRTSASQTMSVYETSVFQCKRFLDTNIVTFSTYYDFCTGQFDSENRCKDYCASQSTRRRRASDTENETLEIVTSITIMTGDEENKNKDASGLPTYLTATIIAGTVILLMAIVFVAVFVCLVRRRRYSRDNQSDVDSRASSDRKLPVL